LADVSEFDAPIIAWFEQQGWPGAQRVQGGGDAFDRDYFSWRAGEGAAAKHLRVSLRVIQNLSTAALIATLNAASVGNFIGRRGCAVIQANSRGGPQVVSC
jgi:hypothetical protein